MRSRVDKKTVIINRGLVVSTLAEAEYFAGAGFDDILVPTSYNRFSSSPTKRPNKLERLPLATLSSLV